MKKRILLISGNFSPELTGIGKYNGEMVNWLAANGYDCSVITTFPYYPHWKIDESYSKRSFWYKREHAKLEHPFTTLRCPHYVPSKPTGARRLLSEVSILLSFSFGLIPLLFKKKYDYVVVVAPSFMLGLLGIVYKKLRGATFINHVQDLQIDAARDFGMINSDVMINFLLGIEKYIFGHANAVTTISTGMQSRLEEKSGQKVGLFPNWVDLKMFYPIYDKASCKHKFGFNSTDKIFLYSGAIGEKQGIEMIIRAANSFKDCKNARFVICGAGPYKQQLEDMAISLSLKNVSFLPLQPINKFNLLLNMADVHLILQKSNAKDLLLPSKLSAILAVGGTPVVAALPGTSLYEIISNSQIGCIVEPENQKSFEKCITNLLKNEVVVDSNKTRGYAEANLSIDVILSSFTENILKQGQSKTVPVSSKKFFSKALAE